MLTYNNLTASDRPKRVEEETESYHGITALSHVYVLADMLMCSTLKNLAIDTLIAFQSTRCLLPWPSIVRHVYEHTTDASKLRQLFVDLHVHEAASRYFDAESVYPTAHTNAMVRKFIDGKGSWFQMNQAPYHKRQICAMYHEHVEGEKKCGRWIHGCGRYEEEAP